jgi:tetratricopeptide (TPR) repeat protein
VSFAYLLLKQGRNEEAGEVMEHVMKGSGLKGNEEINAKSTMALVLWKKGDLDGAVEMLTDLHDKYKNSTVYGSLGYLLMLQGDYKKALGYNLEAYEYNGSDKVIQDNLGQNYYLLGEYDKAQEVYEKLIEESPQFPEPYYFYGKVLIARGKLEEGLESMKKAMNYKFSFLSTTTMEEIEEEIKKCEAQIIGTKG